MAHDVFLSYSSIDKTAADTVCSVLEQNGINCWIAPRDITPGLDFAEAIIDGIKSSKLFILVYSSNSNNSKQVIREVDRAVHLGLPVINLRLEDVPLSKQLEYYLSSVHWLDAKTPPMEKHIDKLSGVIKILLRRDGAKEEDLEKAIRDGILHVGQDKKSIAVLPFKNMSNDPDQEYFSDGMMEEILDRLFKIGDLKVISRTSSMHYKNSDKSIKEIARELKVGNIIEGSVRRIGNNVRIAVQLIDAATDAHLWSEIYNGDLSDLSRIFHIQSEVAQSVARELKTVISPREKELIEKMPSIDLAVYEEYLKARSYLFEGGSQQELNQALEYLNNTVKKNPGWAPLYGGRAEVWMLIQLGGYEPPSVTGPKILENLNKAMELDPDTPGMHYLNGLVAQWVEWDWEKSEKEFLKALALNPNDAQSRLLYAQLLLILHRKDEGMAQARLAISLDPVNPNSKFFYAGSLAQAGEYEIALPLMEEIVADNPLNISGYYMIEVTAFRLKEYNKAINAAKHVLPFYNIKEEDIIEFERTYNNQGITKANEVVAKLLEKFLENNYESPHDIALRYIYADQPDKAMDWIEKGYEMHDPKMMYIASPARYFDALYEDPRFITICEKMNLPLPEPD
jgi:TolB-like protein